MLQYEVSAFVSVVSCLGEEGVRCYECNSGTPDKTNPLCPPDGNLDPELVTNATCNPGSCMAKQSKANPGSEF